MSDTLQNVELPPRIWVDLYMQSGFKVGTQFIVQNIGVCDVYLASQKEKPTDDNAHQIISRGEMAINEEGDSGAWAYCYEGGLLNARLP
jgi:hypothetical protein